MKYKNKLLIYITTFVITFTNISMCFLSIPVHASDNETGLHHSFPAMMQAAKDAHLALQDYIISTSPTPGNKKVEQFFRIVSTPLGYIVGYNEALTEHFHQMFSGKTYGSTTINSSDTEEEACKKIAEVVTNNIEVTDSQININPTGKQILNDYYDYLNNNSGFVYGQTYDMGIYLNKFSDSYHYNALKSLIHNNPDKYVLGFQQSDALLIPNNGSISFVKNIVWKSVLYSTNEWESINRLNVTNFHYDNDTHQYVEVEPTVNSGILVSHLGPGYYDYYNANILTEPNWVIWSDGGSYLFRVYLTVDDLKSASVGAQPYYQAPSYINYKNDSSNNTYTIDNSNYNPISYGDITNYIDSYNTQNGTNPTDQQINIYIETGDPDDMPGVEPTPTPTPNPDNPGGGGSDDDSESLFDWLSKIGSLIGNLISGLGGFIAGVLEGVVNALTSILDTITSIITTITTSIPDNFNTLMTTILGWLPEEWTAVISAFLLVSLLVGLFKLFRG